MPQTNDTLHHFDTLLQLGHSQTELGQWRAAHKSFKQILKHIPGHPEANLARIKLFLIQNKLSKAQKYLQEMLNRPNLPLDALLLWAENFGQSNRTDTLNQLMKALEYSPDHPELLLQLSFYLKLENKPQQALVHLNRCAQVPSLSGELWLGIAHLFLELGELSQAVNAFAKAIELAPELREDPRWIDIEGNWENIEAKIQPLDLIYVADQLEKD